MKYISILGSTGSIGIQTLQVIRELGHDFKVVALAARSNVDLIKSQIEQFQPETVALADESSADILRSHLNGNSVRVMSGNEGIIQVATMPKADIVVSGMVGIAGLIPTLEAIKAGKDIALANKEVLVTSGSLITSTARQMGVNLLPVDGGGTHINFFFDLLKEFFQSKTKKYELPFQPNDCLYGLRAYFILNLIEPKFVGQTKEKLANPKAYYDRFEKHLRNRLEDFAKKDEDTLIEYLKRFHNYRASMDSKKLQGNGHTRRASTQFTKLRDCTSRHGELYIVEGDSAGGTLVQSRDPHMHAILPLRGKSIPNVTMKKDILKNKEVGELIRAIGTGVGPHFDLSKIRYDRIVCATDADPDGAHIACLVTMVIGILLPEIIKAGRYYIAQTPLFSINEGKTFIPLWNEKQLEKARKEDRKIQRYKGLGEMNPIQLKLSLLDPKLRHHNQIKYSGNIDELINLFSSAEEKRKLVSSEE